MLDWINTAQRIAAIVAVIFATVAWGNLGLPRLVFSPELAPIRRRIEALEQFNRDTRVLALDQAWWSANPLGMLWPGMDAAFETSGGGNGGPPAAAPRPDDLGLRDPRLQTGAHRALEHPAEALGPSAGGIRSGSIGPAGARAGRSRRTNGSP